MTDILTVLNNIGYSQLMDCGQFWRTNALYRQGDNPTALSIDKYTGDYYDFVAKKGGKFQDLILRTLNLPTGTNINTVIPDFSVPIVAGHAVELTETRTFDRSYLLKIIKDHTYWNNRGISNTILDSLQGGVVETTGRMKDRYVWPLFNDRNQIIGFTGRTLKNSTVKYKHLGKKNEWVFPLCSLPEIERTKQAILIESPGDCVSLMEVGIKNSLVLFGTNISTKLLCILLRMDVNLITILLNNDFENNFVGNDASVKVKTKLLRHFDEHQIRIITPPVNDLNEFLVNDRETFIQFCKDNSLFN